MSPSDPPKKTPKKPTGRRTRNTSTEDRAVRLGEAQAYVEKYDVGLLQPIARAAARQSLPLQAFHGVDVWTAYELSWLMPGGKPQVAVAEFFVPADSPNIIESKSFKYYLNSLNQTVFDGIDEVQQTLQRDLSAAAGSRVDVVLYTLSAFASKRSSIKPFGQLLDGLPVGVPEYRPSASLLELNEGRFSGVWCSHLLKSNCPVTGQPDWASIWVGWQGPAVKPESLLAYLISYRQHQDFHEHCVERIFCDLMAIGQPEDFWVYARYTRRGGLDINPLRSSASNLSIPDLVGARQ